LVDGLPWSTALDPLLDTEETDALVPLDSTRSRKPGESEVTDCEGPVLSAGLLEADSSAAKSHQCMQNKTKKALKSNA